MSFWLTEREFRSDRVAHQLTLNVAFLQEIKDDNVQLKSLVTQLKDTFSTNKVVPTRWMVDRLNELRDALETHFALEEFYGYFQPAHESQSKIGTQANRLQSQHETIYLEVCELVDLAESILYREAPPIKKSHAAIVNGFNRFVEHFRAHEQEEMELMMQLCNQEIGVGD